MPSPERLKEIQEKFEHQAKNVSHELESLRARVSECNPEAARLVFEAKNSLEQLDQEAMGFMLLEDISYNEYSKFKQSYISLDSQLLDLVDKFVHECKCSK